MNTNKPENNRYLIYSMLGREIEFNSPRPRGFKRLRGVVQRVCRDIFRNSVELTVDGQVHCFEEPTAITASGSDIVFVYGQRPSDQSDEELFRVLRDDSFVGATVNDAIAHTKTSAIKSLRFAVGGRVIRQRRQWRRAEPVPACA